eukprot:616522-Hanusia_phi.AAC.1
MAAALAVQGDAEGANASQSVGANCSAACERCNMYGEALMVTCSANICNCNGRCDGLGRCICFDGWTGMTCNISVVNVSEWDVLSNDTVGTSVASFPESTSSASTPAVTDLYDVTGGADINGT